MNLAELRSRFRQRADDAVAPYLWGDDEIDAYANEAVAEAAERARLIFDALTPSITTLVAAPERSLYPLDDSILWIERVAVASTGHRLAPTDVAQLDRMGCWEEHTGTPVFYVQQGDKLLLYPRPHQRTRIRLGVYRLPTHPMANPGDRPEIEARHHERLVDWMLYRAYSKRDEEAADPRLADRHLGAFIASFGERADADTQRLQAERRRPVTRMNSEWGGGPALTARRRGRY